MCSYGLLHNRSIHAPASIQHVHISNIYTQMICSCISGNPSLDTIFPENIYPLLFQKKNKVSSGENTPTKIYSPVSK